MRENRVYVDGNTVRRERQVEERPVREVRRSAGAAAGRRRKVRRWNVAFFGFMIAAVGMIALCLSWYILVNASITAKPFFERRGYRVVREQQIERKDVILTNFAMEKDMR